MLFKHGLVTLYRRKVFFLNAFNSYKIGVYIDDLPIKPTSLQIFDLQSNLQLTNTFLPANQTCFVFRILLMLVILGADQNDGSLWQ